MATVGAAGVEIAQEVLAEAQDAMLPLVRYLDGIRWLFIGAALAGIAARSTPGLTIGRGAAVISGERAGRESG